MHLPVRADYGTRTGAHVNKSRGPFPTSGGGWTLEHRFRARPDHSIPAAYVLTRQRAANPRSQGPPSSPSPTAIWSPDSFTHPSRSLPALGPAQLASVIEDSDNTRRLFAAHGAPDGPNSCPDLRVGLAETAVATGRERVRGRHLTAHHTHARQGGSEPRLTREPTLSTPSPWL